MKLCLHKIIIICIFTLLCIGCGKEKQSDIPEFMTKNAYEKGLEALDIIDSFLVSGISRENAIKELNSICDEITYTKDEKEEYYKAFSVKVNISSLSQKLSSFGTVGLGTGGNRSLFEQAANSALEDIEKTRNDLAELLEVNDDTI